MKKSRFCVFQVSHNIDYVEWNSLMSFSTFGPSVQFSSVQSLSRVSLQTHESQHGRPPCLSPTPGVYPSSCPSSWWCHPAISSLAVPFSSCHQSLPASGWFPMSQLFAWGGQSIGFSASASVLPMNTQGWSHLGWTGWMSERLLLNNKKQIQSGARDEAGSLRAFV